MIIGLLATMAPTGFAQTPQNTPLLSDEEAIVLMQAYGIVKGDETGNLRLEDNITRAQAAAIFVRALNRFEMVPLLKDQKEYEDTLGHWGNGEIVLAKRLGLMQGSGGYFRPNDNITYAELMTVMLRMVGREPAGPWNADAIMLKAEELGVTPSVSDVRLLGGIPAVRGRVFKALALTMTAVPLASGETLLAREFDKTPPEVALDSVPAQASSDTLTVSGQVKDAWKVWVNGIPATVAGTRFTATIKLQGGSNEVSVTAVDYAGNTATKTATVSLGGAPDRIDVDGATQVSAGQTASIKATAYDANGVKLAGSVITAEVTGNIGTYNVTTGEFKAGAAAGAGTIKFTAGTVTTTHTVIVTGVASAAAALRFRTINSGRLLSIDRAQTVVVEVVDADGQILTVDSDRQISITSSSTDMALNTTNVLSASGTGTITVTPSKEGEYTLTARSAGLTTASVDVVVGSSTRVVLKADPTSMVANGSNVSTIRAYLEDENGDAVMNRTDSDLVVVLSNTGVGSLTDNMAIIRRGASNSVGWDGHLLAEGRGGTATVSGRITSGQIYTVQSASISLSQLVIGAPSRLEIVGSGGVKRPNTDIPLSIRVTDKDGNAITTGTYAFQIQVTTSNTQDEVANGLPDGVEVYLGDALVPVYGGGTTSITGRTVEGVANLTVRSTKSGKVTLKPIGVSSTNTAYDDEGEPDAASSTSNWEGVASTVTFDDVAGGTAGIELVWDLTSLKLDDQTTAVLSANGTSSAKLRAYLVDAEGGRRPAGGGDLTITKGATTASRVIDDEVPVREGTAEFTIVSSRTPGVDEWTVTYSEGANPTATAKIQTRDEKPAKPSIWSVFSESGSTTRIEISDEYLEILLDGVAGEYGAVKVYTVSNGKLIYTSDVMDLTGTPSVKVPKEVIPFGADRYKVAINTGYGDSSYSDPYPSTTADPIVNAKPTTIDITAVRYDAESSKLTVSAAGVSSSNGGTIHPELLTLRKISELPISLAGAECTTSSSSFTCDLTSFGFSASTMNGAWLLDTEDGWFTKTSTGDSAEADEKTENNYVTPFAYITHAAVDFAAGKITLYGVNLNNGSLNLSKLYIDDPDNILGTSTSTKSSSPTEITLTLPTTTASAVRALDGTNIQLNGELGWIKDSSGNENGALDVPAPVLAQTSVGYVSYNATTDRLIINAKGISGGTVDVSMIAFKDRTGTERLRLDPAKVEVLNLVAGKLNGDKVEIDMGDQAADLEALPNNNRIFVTSDPTDAATPEAWVIDAEGRPGTTILNLKYPLSW